MPTVDGRAVRGAETRARILRETRIELSKNGLDLTLDRIAERLAITKQAVLYHFPSKNRLLVELALLGLAEEAEAMAAAVAPARSAAEAISRFLRENLAFHLRDIERFRVMYVHAQVARGAKKALSPQLRKTRLYPVTSRMYSALESKIRADSSFPSDLDARTLAVSVHLAAIGFATMAGELAEAKDQMKLPFERYVDTLARAIGKGVSLGGARARR